MNIAHLTNAVQWSGGAQQVLLLAKGLRERGHRNWILCPPDSQLHERAKAAGLETVVVPFRQDYDVFSAWAIRSFVKRNGVDVLHAHHPTAHAVGLIAACLSGVKGFFVTRRVIFPLRLNPFSKWKYLSRRIDRYVAVTEAVAKTLEAGGVRPERITVIPSVVEPFARLSEDRKQVREEWGVPQDAILAGCLANYAPFKGQDVLVKAMELAIREEPRLRVVFAGRDVEKIADLTSDPELQSRMILAGFRKDVHRVLSALDLFVLPSRQEAAATALREAMMAELPVIGTAVGGIPDFVFPGKTGWLIPSEDPQAMSRAILDVIRQPSLAKAVAVEGRAYVEKRFSLENSARLAEEMYQKALPPSR